MIYSFSLFQKKSAPRPLDISAVNYFYLLSFYLRSVLKRHTPIISAYSHEIHHAAPKSVVKFCYCSPLLFQGFHKYVYLLRLSLLLVYHVIDLYYVTYRIQSNLLSYKCHSILIFTFLSLKFTIYQVCVQAYHFLSELRPIFLIVKIVQ